ncbi:TPA: hypothetical protein SLP15_004738 [Klebsiella aerogenes]|nr:hypothetical protein [Klebsiella aerogenes]
MTLFLESLIKAYPHMRSVFKAFPIFASHWLISGFITRTREIIWVGKGGNSYLAYYNAQYATGPMENKLIREEICLIASLYRKTSIPDDLELLAEEAIESAALLKVSYLSKGMNLFGALSFVVIPQRENPNAGYVFVFLGSATAEILQLTISNTVENH